MSAFIDSIMAARTEASDNAAALSECAAKLQEHNRSLKEYIAIGESGALMSVTLPKASFTRSWGRSRSEAVDFI